MQLTKKFWIIIGSLVLINLVLVSLNVTKSRKVKEEYLKLEKIRQSLIQEKQITEAKINFPQKKESREFYNLPCPEITKFSISGDKVDFRELVGRVILIRFSRFYKQDFPSLIYLEHVAEKYRKYGVSLIFINTLGKHDEKTISKSIKLTSQVIEDDGSISASFNALPEDLIIVDRNFLIKYKHNLGSKSIIYNEVVKRTFEKIIPPPNPTRNEQASFFNNLSYYDVLKDRKVQTLGKTSGKKQIITFFTSVCTGCNENARIRLLDELSRKINKKKSQVIILFGKGNNKEAIRQFIYLNNWNEIPITVGNFNDLNKIETENYYKLFQLDIDPKTFILNKEGEVIFCENLRNSKLVNMDLLVGQNDVL